MRMKRPLPPTRGAPRGEPVTFVVAQVGRADERSLIATGRCAGGTLARGVAFVLATEAVVSEEGGALVTRHARERAVSLTVDAIEAYGRPWKTLEAGMTAVVSLSGAGAEAVRAGDVLHTAPPAARAG